eukprot:COSAG02_NODE_15895_length_1132_cov_1.493708_1_plen_114_part_00
MEAELEDAARKMCVEYASGLCACPARLIRICCCSLSNKKIEGVICADPEGLCLLGECRKAMRGLLCLPRQVVALRSLACSAVMAASEHWNARFALYSTRHRNFSVCWQHCFSG